MKKIGILAAAALVLGVGIASAQMRPPHVPLPKPPDNLKSMHFPASSAQYEKIVQWYLALIRSFPTRFRITQGDTDTIILHLKDCAGRIESDGIVTKSEADYCNNTTMAKVQEVITPYIMQQAGGTEN